MSCHVMSCPIISCHVLSYHVISCHVMPCHVILCQAGSWDSQDLRFTQVQHKCKSKCRRGRRCGYLLGSITSSLLFLFLIQQWGYRCLPCLPPVVESVSAALVPLAMQCAAERGGVGGGGRGGGGRGGSWMVTAADCASCAFDAILAITCSSTHPATLILILTLILTLTLILSLRGYCHTVWSNNTCEQFRTTKIEYNAKRIRAEWENER